MDGVAGLKTYQAGPPAHGAGKEIEKACQGIFPLQNTAIRKVKVLRAPKLDITKLMEVRHPRVGSWHAQAMPIRVEAVWVSLDGVRSGGPEVERVAKVGGSALLIEGIGRGTALKVRLEEATAAAVRDNALPATSACLDSSVP